MMQNMPMPQMGDKKLPPWLQKKEITEPGVPPKKTAKKEPDKKKKKSSKKLPAKKGSPAKGKK